MELENILKEILRTSVENSEIAGANFLVIKDGKEMVYVQAGMADREAGREIKRDTIFRLYSQTKPVTSVAAMILMERGLLDFYAPVSEFSPFLCTDVCGENRGEDSLYKTDSCK